MRIRLGGVALVLALTSSAPAADPRIINGPLTFSHPSVGTLIRGADTPEMSDLRCSGTLIGCSTFLTAAHCVCDVFRGGEACQPGDQHAPDPSDYWVFLPNGGIFPVDGIDVHPDFAFPLGADVAIVHLREPVTGIEPAAVNLTAPVPFGTPATIVGYGRTDNGASAGPKRRGRVTTARCRFGVPNATSVCFDFDEPLGPVGLDSANCYGDSGGALFVDFGCGETLAGVTSGGMTDEYCAPPIHDFDTDVYAHRDWLAAHAGADLGDQACGPLVPVGHPGTVTTNIDGELSNQAPTATHVVQVAPGADTLRVGLASQIQENGYVDLYVRAGAPPTTSTFDCKKEGVGPYGVCELPSPAAGPWYVMVVRVGVGRNQYQVMASAFGLGSAPIEPDGEACDDGNSCTETGTCQGAQCVTPPVADGTPCADTTLCTHDDVCTAGACVGTVAPAVCSPALRGADIRWQHHPADAQRLLKWKMKSSSGNGVADFGTPDATTRYELCIYDAAAGDHRLAFTSSIAPNPDWRPSPTGWKFRDKRGEFDGTTQLSVKARSDGGATIGYMAKGYFLNRPGTPYAQDPEVRVQLTTGNACWDARYTTNKGNTGGTFRAKSE